MSDPVVDTQFTTGTVITADWLNGVNDFVNTDGATKAYADAAVAALRVQVEKIVSSITALKAVDKTQFSHVFVTGYYTQGDGGGGAYWYDSTDTTSADNGGTIIVATDGARWKLIYSGILNVRQFGAKGDGTTDDTAAIQNTINVFASGNGGEVFVPNGTYAITGTGLTLPETIPTTGFDGLILRGGGQGTSFKKTSAANSILRINGARCTVTGITFNMNNISTTGIFLNTLFDGQTTLIENCAFTTCLAGGQAIFNNAGDSYLIRNNYFLNVGNWAFESTTNAINSSFSSNFVQGSGGVHLNNTGANQAEGVRILDNTFLTTGGSGYAIDVEFGLEIIISNNILDQTLTGGIRIRNNASYVKVTSNWIAVGTAGGVILGDNANRIFVIGNTFEGNGASHVIANSAALGNMNSLTIQDNIHGNIGVAFVGILCINVKRASICGNIMPGPNGTESILWATGAVGIIANNAVWKAPNVDGTGTSVNNVVG